MSLSLNACLAECGFTDEGNWCSGVHFHGKVMSIHLNCSLGWSWTCIFDRIQCLLAIACWLLFNLVSSFLPVVSYRIWRIGLGSAHFCQVPFFATWMTTSNVHVLPCNDEWLHYARPHIWSMNSFCLSLTCTGGFVSHFIYCIFCRRYIC